MHSHPLLKKVYEDVYRPTLPADHRPADRTGLNRELASAQTRLVTAICGRAAYTFKAIAKALRVLVFVMGEKSDAQGLKVVRNILGVAFGQEAMQALLEEGDDDDDDPLAATGARPSKAPRAAAKAKAAGDDAGDADADADDEDEDENDDGDAEGDADADEDEDEEGEHVATGGDRRKGLRGPRKAPDLVHVTPAMAAIIAARNEQEAITGSLIKDFEAKINEFFRHIRQSKECERFIVKIKSHVSEEEIYNDFAIIYRRYKALHRQTIGDYFFKETEDLVEKLCDDFERTVVGSHL